MPTTQTTNGIKLMTKIVDLGKTNPITAIVLGLIVLALFTGGVSFGASFLGQGSQITNAIAQLKRGNKSRKQILPNPKTHLPKMQPTVRPHCKS